MMEILDKIDQVIFEKNDAIMTLMWLEDVQIKEKVE